MPTSTFPVGVAEKLKTYVYRLIDPRNGESFYIGKGVGDRVFAHVLDQIKDEDPSNKLKRIREIHIAGFEVAHVIHRHGMDDKTAFEVEAALMDAYPGLTNIASGAGSANYGAMHAEEAIRRYSAPIAIFKHRALLITVNRSATEVSLYEATRYAWKVARTKVIQAEVILSVVQGLIVGAFIAREWLPATPENFPNREPMLGRFAFNGSVAPPDLSQYYVGKRLPDIFRKPGAANPVKYTWS